MKAKKQDKRSPNVPVTDTRRRNLLILGGGAALAAGLGAVGYKAGWFSEAPAPTPTPAPTPVPARLSLGPKLTPVTLDPPNYENALRSANEMMEYYARSIDNPYCLIHAIRAFGKNFVRKDGSNAVNYLCTTHAADMQVNGKYYVYFELINEVHQNSFLKTFLEAGVSRDQKLTVQGRQYTVNNLAESAKALFRFDPNNLARFDPKYAQEHLPWGIIAFSILMTPDNCSWTNAYGEKKTRVFGTTLGHNNDTCADARYLDLITRGLLWSVDKLDDKHLKPAKNEPKAEASATVVATAQAQAQGCDCEDDAK